MTHAPAGLAVGLVGYPGITGRLGLPEAILAGAPAAPTMPAPALRRGPSRSTQDLREPAAALALMPLPMAAADAPDNLPLQRVPGAGAALPLSLPRNLNPLTSRVFACSSS